MRADRFFFALTVAAALPVAALAEAVPELTMSPTGEVTSLASALERIRAGRRSGRLPADRVVTVKVMPGVYRQTAPARFGAGDSHLRFVGAGRGVSVFDGGVELPPFAAGAGGVWECPTPEGLRFEQCYVNGRRARRACTPNRDYLYMVAPYDDDVDPVTGEISDDISRRAFYARPEDVAPLAKLSAKELSRVTFLFWQSWDMGYGALNGVDAKSGLVTASGAATYALFPWSSRLPRYRLENYRAALDAPGEWFHDEDAHRLFYIPRPGETLDATRAVAPVAEGLLDFHGRAGKRVSDVVFEKVSFVHSGFLMPPAGQPNFQAASNIKAAAIRTERAEGIVFREAEVKHVGAHAVMFAADSVRSGLEKTLVEDVGAIGVGIAGSSELPASELFVVNSIVRNIGVTFHGAVAVWLLGAHDCRIEHNDIGDTRYSAVSMGFTWGYVPTVVRRNRLNYNRIHHVGWGTLGDMGAVYTLGDLDGTEVIGNWISDVYAYPYGSPGWGLYTDEGSHGIIFASNLVERCRDGAIHHHYGKACAYKNNLFVDCERNMLWTGAVEKHIGVIVSNNVCYWREPETCALWSSHGRTKITADSARFGRNLYWCASGAVNGHAFDWLDFDAWRKKGHDRESAIADPGFADPARGDWRLKADSPALRMGFKPFDWHRAGILRDDPGWAALADSVSYPPMVDADRPATFPVGTYRQNFDRSRPGFSRPGHQLGGFTIDVGCPEQIEVVARDGDGANRCLRFTNAGKRKYPWQPHLERKLFIDSGEAGVRFSIKADANAEVAFDCRDYHPAEGEYALGPAIRIRQGRIWAGGRALAALPAGAWVKFELTMTLGVPAAPWKCTLTLPGGERKSAEFRLAADSRFRTFDRMDFMSSDCGEGAWHLDDFELTTVNFK